MLSGYKAHLSYSQALCHYRSANYAQALKHIADIIERGIREHPELSVGMTTEGIEVRSVGNSKVGAKKRNSCSEQLTAHLVGSARDSAC